MTSDGGDAQTASTIRAVGQGGRGGIEIEIAIKRMWRGSREKSVDLDARAGVEVGTGATGAEMCVDGRGMTRDATGTAAREDAEQSSVRPRGRASRF